MRERRQTPTNLYNSDSSKFAHPERTRICTMGKVPRELRQYALVDMILHQGITQKAIGGHLGHLATTPSLKPCTHCSAYLGLHLVSMPVHGDQFRLGIRYWRWFSTLGEIGRRRQQPPLVLRCMNHLRVLFPLSSDKQSSKSGIYVVCDTSNREPREGYHVNRRSSGSSVSLNRDRCQRMSKSSWVSVIRFVFQSATVGELFQDVANLHNSQPAKRVVRYGGYIQDSRTPRS